MKNFHLEHDDTHRQLLNQIDLFTEDEIEKLEAKINKLSEEYDKLNATDYLCEIPYVIIGEPTYNQNDAR